MYILYAGGGNRMGIAIENFGKGHVSRLSKLIMAQAGISYDDKAAINWEHECMTLQKIYASKADRFME